MLPEYQNPKIYNWQLWNEKIGSNLQVGQLYGGGVVFHTWIDEAGQQRGLVLNLVDLSTGAAWSDAVLGDYAGAFSPWDGVTNTEAIINQVGSTASAALLCTDLIDGEYEDWYLPASQELALIWNNYYTISKTLTQTEGATLLNPDAKYWSSTEIDGGPYDAFYFKFSNGTLLTDNKEVLNYVRAIRQF